MKLLTPVALCCAAILAFASCNNKEDKNIVPKTKKQSLINGKWYPEHVKTYSIYDGDTSLTEDNISDFDSCDQDDFGVYNADGTMRGDEGPTKCDPSDPQTIDGGYWQLLENDTKLRLFNPNSAWFPEDTVTADVLTLTDDLLQYHYTYEQVAFGVYFYLEVTESYRNK